MFKKFLKSSFKILIIIFIIITLIVLSKPYIWTSELIKEARDDNLITNFKVIDNLIKVNKNYSFNNLNEFNKVYNTKINSGINCYYLKWYNDSWYIFVGKYESKKI